MCDITFIINSQKMTDGKKMNLIQLMSNELQWFFMNINSNMA
jgi:hypothetical protein